MSGRHITVGIRNTHPAIYAPPPPCARACTHLRHGLALQWVHHVGVVEREHHRVVDGAARRGVEAASLQEASAEHHVHVTHEQQNVALGPVRRPDLQRHTDMNTSVSTIHRTYITSTATIIHLPSFRLILAPRHTLDPFPPQPRPSCDSKTSKVLFFG